MVALEENRQLLEQFRRGATDALDQVFAQYSPKVAAMLRHGFQFESGGRVCRYRGAHSTFDLEDRLHDVFARAFSERARLAYDGIQPYERYVGGIARNLVIDDFRKKSHALIDYVLLDDIALSSSAEALPMTPGRPSDAHAAAEANELRDLVARFKDGLNAREREIYELRFEEELEHKDIVVRTGLSASKIKTSERRIRERFFDFLRKHGYFAGYEKRPGGWLRILSVF